MMRKAVRPTFILLIGFHLLILFSLEKAYARENSPHPLQTGSFRVAMLLPGSIDDHSFNTNGYRGLMLIKKRLGADVAFTQNVNESDYDTFFRRYAKEGYDLIIGWGAQFLPSIKKAADGFPETSFMIFAYYSGNNRNLGAISFWQGEIGYLAGTVAGMKTKSGKVAFLTGFLYSHQKEKASLFRRGVKSVNPEAQVKILSIKTWKDQEKAITAGQMLIDDDFDVIAVDADSAGCPVHELAQKAGKHTIGWSVDQYDLAPRSILTSAVQRSELVVLEGAKIVRLGQWEGKQYKFGIRSGVQYLAPFRGALTLEEEKRIMKIREDILAGEINIIQFTKD